jgi:hypothetical protein
MLISGDAEYAAAELEEVRAREGLDVLTVTDGRIVLLRTSNPGQVGDDQGQDQIVGAVLRSGSAVASTVIVPGRIWCWDRRCSPNGRGSGTSTPVGPQRTETVRPRDDAQGGRPVLGETGP